MPLGTKVGVDLGDIVLDRDPAPPAPPQKRGHSPQFSARVCCGEIGGLIKMPLDTEVCLGTGHIVLDWDPAPAKKRGTPPIFGPSLL